MPTAMTLLDIILELLLLLKRAEAGDDVTDEQIAAVFAKANKAEREWEDAE